MTRIVLFLLAVLALAAGLHWLADRPGTIVVEWQDYVAETSVLRALILLTAFIAAILLTWSTLRWIWSSPAAIGRVLRRRQERRGLDALSGGIIAIGAGDRALAMRYAGQARKALPHEPLTHLLRAQAAQLSGDRVTSRRIFEAMLASPDTEQLGLRGLFLEAQREGELEAAKQFSERALALNPKLGWPVEALFDLQCRAADWQGALDTLAVARRQNLVDKVAFNRRRAVLLTARAQAAEDAGSEKALELALEAHRLAPDLVPAAAIAGRVLASQGNTPRAARVLLKTWRLAPHPDLAVAYAYARPGDSPRDRLNRVRHLGRLVSNDSEGPIALAITAIEAREWDEARKALELLLEGRLTQRVCTLMARIEGEQHGHTGRVREWLARAINAPRDPAWTADGVVSEHWAPVSPVTGALDAFRWRVPVEAIDAPKGALLAAKVEALVGLGAGSEPALEHSPVAKPADVLPGGPVEEIVRLQLRPLTAEPPAPATAARSTPVDIPADIVTPPPPSEHAVPVPSSATDAGLEMRKEKARAAEATAAKPARQEDQPTVKAVPPAKPDRASNRVRKRPEPKIFVPPRAPDDPGPDPVDEDGVGIGPFRPSEAKA